MKKILCLFLTVLVLASCVTSTEAKEYESFSWYVKREKNHCQPGIETEMQTALANDGYYIDKNHGKDSTDKVVYLTFDAGYENGNVKKILDTLKEENVKGAFFILSHLIHAEPDLVTRMEKEGHLVCNHTSRHKNMCCLTSEEQKKEIQTLEREYQELTGKSLAKYFRPPEGRFNAQTVKEAANLGYKTVFWSLAYADWDNQKQPSEEYAMNKLMENMHNGAIILLHPTSATNAKILKQFIQSLKEQGYRFGTLDELGQ